MCPVLVVEVYSEGNPVYVTDEQPTIQIVLLEATYRFVLVLRLGSYFSRRELLEGLAQNVDGLRVIYSNDHLVLRVFVEVLLHVFYDRIDLRVLDHLQALENGRLLLYHLLRLVVDYVHDVRNAVRAYLTVFVIEFEVRVDHGHGVLVLRLQHLRGLPFQKQVPEKRFELSRVFLLLVLLLSQRDQAPYHVDFFVVKQLRAVKGLSFLAELIL